MLIAHGHNDCWRAGGVLCFLTCRWCLFKMNKCGLSYGSGSCRQDGEALAWACLGTSIIVFFCCFVAVFAAGWFGVMPSTGCIVFSGVGGDLSLGVFFYSVVVMEARFKC